MLLQKRIPGVKGNIKSPKMYPPRKDPITNKDIIVIITEQDPSLPPIIAKYPHGYKPLFNNTHDPNIIGDYPNYYTDNSRNKKEDSVNKLKFANNKDNGYEYKDGNYAAPKND